MTAVGHIAVVGRGLAAWTAAAAVAVRLPGVRVTVVEDAAAPPSLADLVATANPSLADFHDDLRLDERALLRDVDGVFRLGARFRGWSGAAGGPYLHTHGEHGEPLAAAPFHQHWLRFGAAAGDFAGYSVASALASTGRFVHPADDGVLARFAYGLHLDAAGYAAALRTIATDRGVAVVAGLRHAIVSADGRIAELELADGTAMSADLYIDAGGAVADALDARRVDWSHWLPVGHLSAGRIGASSAPALVDEVAAGPTGWQLTAPLRAAQVVAVASVEPLPGGVAFRQGRRAAPWVGNVVAIGDAAVTLEPLEGIALHLLHAHVDRIVSHLPGIDFAAVEIADYNRQTIDEADRLRDFVVLHYHFAGRDEVLWRDLAATAPPASLAHDLALFRERGHLPVHDGDSFTADSWLAVLIGQGVRPRRADPVAAELPLDRARAVLDGLRAAIDRAVASAPRHADYLAAYVEDDR